MSDTKNLLVELFVEELPPKALKKLGEAFANDIAAQLRRLDFLTPDSIATSFASPRRLAVHVSGVRAKCPDVPVRKKLIPTNIAFDEKGHPSAALQKRLDREEATLQDVARAFEDGKEFTFLERVAPGKELSFVLEDVVLASLSNLPIPKVMTYQLADGWSTVNFVRPVHGLVSLHGADVVPISVLGLQAGRNTHGHRFEASVDPVVLNDADSYAQQLEAEGAVIASFAGRRAEIERQLEAAAAKAGGKPIADEALLDEVTALVERPNVLIGQFEEAFLEVPQECLILTMKANQKYFPLLDGAGKLTNKFLIVSNIRPTDPSAVIGGNERVVRPRLADAKFFFDQDRKRKLEDRVAGLGKVTYLNAFEGHASMFHRMERVRFIAHAIGKRLGGDSLAEDAATAARLAKADLLTDMVGEFPELQGIMGRYYALHDGLSTDIADAIEDHYKPRFAGDSLPRGRVGLVVALADKLETLVGLFGIGQTPTGDKDPFALRRHALGVVRMLSENQIDLPLNGLLTIASAAFNPALDSVSDDNVPFEFGYRTANVGKGRVNPENSPADFIYERLAGSLRDQGYSPQEVDAVVSLRPQRLGDIPKRLAAVRAFAALPEAASLAAANKRVGNILKKSQTIPEGDILADLLREPAEKDFLDALRSVSKTANTAFDAGDYTAHLLSLAALKVPVDSFFDQVMVNVEDADLRTNRLRLLMALHASMNRIADLSKLST
ncbi:MAG: glycine--tRNA ligase subunit beta [Proteobacteria bacterium]|nr:glycine--tRNA ligase subunit beta [Pseudomonadota bacterium]